MASLRPSDMALPQELKLKGSVNIKAWKSLVENTLKQNQLYSHLDPETHKESDGKGAEPDAKATKADATKEGPNSLVKMMLCINIDPDFVTIVMEHELAFDGYTALCRFIEGNTIAALETSLTSFIDLSSNFDSFSSPAEYILEHKAMVSRQQQLATLCPLSYTVFSSFVLPLLSTLSGPLINDSICRLLRKRHQLQLYLPST